MGSLSTLRFAYNPEGKMKRNLFVVKWVLIFATSLLIVFTLTVSVQATVLFVDANKPSSGSGLSWAEAFKTIQEAVDAAVTNDEVWIKRETYSLFAPISVSKSISLFGGFDGSEQNRSERDWVNNITIVDGQGTTGCFTVSNEMVLDGFALTNGMRAVTISNTSTTRINVIIANCTFTDNSALEGGAIQIYKVFLQLKNCVFENNTATWTSGGAIHNDFGSLLIQQCIFINNRALQGEGNIQNGGGAIFNDGQHGRPYCDILNSVFLDNYADYQGGAIGNFNGAVVDIFNCYFSENEAQSFNGGGAIYNSRSNITVNFSDFVLNSTGYGGGAINNSDSLAVITNSSFFNNQANYLGGAIWNWQNQTADPPKIINCVFSDNSTDGDGGAIYNSWSAPNVTNCTFASNSAVTSGGAIFNGGKTYLNQSSKITNCILWNDSAGTYPEIGNSNSTPAVTYCDIQGGYPGTGNKNIAPNMDSDFRLLVGSPCIDAGNNSAPDILSIDKDGKNRIIDGDNNGVARVDMGAYEHGSKYAADFDMDGDVDGSDLQNMILSSTGITLETFAAQFGSSSFNQ
jgi:predicted outer membrane repeat protein